MTSEGTVRHALAPSLSLLLPSLAHFLNISWTVPYLSLARSFPRSLMDSLDVGLGLEMPPSSADSYLEAS